MMTCSTNSTSLEDVLRTDEELLHAQKFIKRIVKKWDTSMNLYTHNCQHFSGFVQELLKNEEICPIQCQQHLYTWQSSSERGRTPTYKISKQLKTQNIMRQCTKYFNSSKYIVISVQIILGNLCTFVISAQFLRVLDLES